MEMRAEEARLIDCCQFVEGGSHTALTAYGKGGISNLVLQAEFRQNSLEHAARSF